MIKKGLKVRVLAGKDKKKEGPDLIEISSLLASLKSEGLSLKQSVKIIKEQGKVSKKVIYTEALKIWG